MPPATLALELKEKTRRNVEIGVPDVVVQVNVDRRAIPAVITITTDLNNASTIKNPLKNDFQKRGLKA